MSGLPAINASGLPGNRVEAYRAGIMPTIFTALFLTTQGADCTEEKARRFGNRSAPVSGRIPIQPMERSLLKHTIESDNLIL
jgi:hypothetical protein